MNTAYSNYIYSQIIIEYQKKHINNSASKPMFVIVNGSVSNDLEKSHNKYNEMMERRFKVLKYNPILRLLTGLKRFEKKELKVFNSPVIFNKNNFVDTFEIIELGTQIKTHTTIKEDGINEVKLLLLDKKEEDKTSTFYING